jgi:hypothetical protein
MESAPVQYGIWFAIAAVLVWHSLRYNFVTDDAYISFVYSRNLAEHGALEFNLGDRVEGYTNFLWTFLLGIVLLITGIPPEISSLVLGTGFAVATTFVALKFAQYVLKDESFMAIVAPALLALSSGFACWASGGLETQMFTFFVTLALYFYVRADGEGRHYRKLGPILALAAMTRPEGLLVAGVLGLHRLGINLIRDRRLITTNDQLACIGGFLLLWAPWFLWRWWYYGYPFPNTYYVKAAGEAPDKYYSQLRANGLSYVKQWAFQSNAIWAAPLALGAMIAKPHSRRFVAATSMVALAVVYLAYTIKVGGDFMGLHRFLMPLFPVVMLLLVFAVKAGIDRCADSCPQPAALIAAAVIVAAFAITQLSLTKEQTRWGNWKAPHGIDPPAYLKAYTDDRAAIGKHMKQCFEKDDFSIVGGAGAQPYFAHMRGIDVFGLVSADIAHNVKPTRPRAGHNKWAPDSLLAKYEPEFVFSCYSIHKTKDNYRLNCRPAFWKSRGYELVTLEIPALKQQGTFYTFLKRKDRKFECPGRVR